MKSVIERQPSIPMPPSVWHRVSAYWDTPIAREIVVTAAELLGVPACWDYVHDIACWVPKGPSPLPSAERPQIKLSDDLRRAINVTC